MRDYDPGETAVTTQEIVTLDAVTGRNKTVIPKGREVKVLERREQEIPAYASPEKALIYRVEDVKTGRDAWVFGFQLLLAGQLELAEVAG